MIILLHRFKNNICMFFFPVKFNILNTFFERLGGGDERLKNNKLGLSSHHRLNIVAYLGDQ
jgi:hypothetical protein